METMFKKTLPDLVRGIRAHKKNEQQFINRALAEIKEELRMNNPKAKMIAVQKLSYLQMLGYDMNWAAFNVIEVMSQAMFTAKRIGYTAASISFHEGTDVIMLTTNLLKKDIQSGNQLETSLALNCLANICTTDLARDLAPDLVALMTSSKPVVRKRSVLTLYKVFLKFPAALRPAYPRLKEKLEDTDMSVVCASVNVICELARKNPKNYLSLAPVLFKILTMSNNNWMLIKIIKLFGALTPLEPRLAKKLVEPLTNIMNTTTAMSLLYECIQTCTIGLTQFPSVVRLCTSKLRLFIEDPDQNLKYLGLLALYNIMKTNPKAVQEHRDMVVFCLDDDDVTIRLRALDLITGMINKRNLMEIVKKLVEKLETADGEYREALVEKIIEVCSQNTYANITDFEWYISVLIELTHVHGTKHGTLLRNQLMDVCIRVNVIRGFGVSNMVTLLKDTRLMSESPTEGGICEVLYAAAWIAGEFIEYAGNFLGIIQSLLNPHAIGLPGHIQSVFVQNALKVLIHIIKSTVASDGPRVLNPADTSSRTANELREALTICKNGLPVFSRSSGLEAQERACFALALIQTIEEFLANGQLEVIKAEVTALLAEPLNPVAPRAQKKVPLPEGLDLDQQLNSPPPSDSESDDEMSAWSSTPAFDERRGPAAEADLASERRARKQRRRNDPFYLGGGEDEDTGEEEEPVPVEQLTNEMLGLSPGTVGSGSQRGFMMPESRKQSGRGRHAPKKVQVVATEEMPDGARADDSDEEKKTGGEDSLFADIDLESALRPDEALKSAAYPAPSVGQPVGQQAQEERRERKSRKSRGGDEGEGGRRHRKGEKRDRSDRGDRRSRRGDKDKKSGAGGSADLLGLGSLAPTQQSSQGSLLDLGAGGAAPSAVPVAVAVAQATPDYRQLESPMGSPGAAAPAAELARPRKGDRKRRDGREGREGRSRRHERDAAPAAAAAAPAAAAAAPGAAGGAVPTHVLAAQNAGEALLHYELAVNPSQPNKVMVSFLISNAHPAQPLTELVFALTETLNAKLVQPAEMRPPFAGIAPGTQNVHRLLLQFSSFVKPQSLSGTLAYKVGGNPSQLNFRVNLPSSAFIQPREVREEEFVSLLQSPLSLASIKFPTPATGPRAVLEGTCALLHVRVVSVTDSAALYGQSIQGHHVCILLKQRGDGVFGADIKASDASLASSLAEELSNFFGRA